MKPSGSLQHQLKSENYETGALHNDSNRDFQSGSGANLHKKDPNYKISWL